MALEGWIDRVAPGLLGALHRALGEPALRFELPDGAQVGAPAECAVGSVRIHDRMALLRALYDPEFETGELYAEGRVSFRGDLVAIVREAFGAGIDTGIVGRIVPRRLFQGVLRQDAPSARRNAQHHYDVGNDFYALWLDERMLYTCAYYPDPADTLEDAQLAKLDHVARKVCLEPGQRVIEAGCGWGALALHMARYYGVTVRAFNVSHEQILYAREQADKQGLSDRVEFIEDDYRNASGRCERFVSVGMLEHVGKEHYKELSDVIDRTLERDGLGFLHTIARARPTRLNRWIETRIFPNAYPPTLKEMMAILEPHDFVTLDVENLRRHYALTIRAWFDRLEQSWSRAEALVGPERTRAWHLYLGGGTAAFELGSLQLFQLVFSRAGNDRIPWTRAHVYSGESPEYQVDGAV